MQGLRRQGRSYALQLLYQIDIVKRSDEPLREAFWSHSHASRRARAFGTELVDAVVAGREEIDGRLGAALERWKLSRLPVIVRNALRLAVCEMTVIRSEPHAVVINEALELIRAYMDEDSARFANSVLEKVRVAWEAEGGNSPTAEGEAGGVESGDDPGPQHGTGGGA